MYLFLVYFAAFTTPMPYEVKVKGVINPYTYTNHKSVYKVIEDQVLLNTEYNKYFNHILVWWAWKQQLRDHEDIEQNWGYCWGLKSNFTLISRRLEIFKDVPYISADDDRLLPFYSTCKDMIDFLPSHIITLEKRKKIDTQHATEYQYYIDKENNLLNAWNLLATLRNQHDLIKQGKGNYYNYRYTLNEYLNLVGPEIYYSGFWPQIDPTVFYLIE